MSTKLSTAKAADIRNRYAAGEKQTTLASEFGVSQGLVSKIVRGLVYPDALGPIKVSGWEHAHGE